MIELKDDGVRLHIIVGPETEYKFTYSLVKGHYLDKNIVTIETYYKFIELEFTDSFKARQFYGKIDSIINSSE